MIAEFMKKYEEQDKPMAFRIRSQVLVFITIFVVMLNLALEQLVYEYIAGFSIVIAIFYFTFKVELRRDSFYISIIFTLISSILVFLMHYEKFVPYAYHAFQNYSLKHNYYSAESFMEKDIKAYRYIETQGMAFPLLSKKSGKIVFNKFKLFFPKDSAMAYISFPKNAKKALVKIEDFEKVEETIANIVSYHNQNYSNDIKQTFEKILHKNENFTQFSSYNILLSEIELKYKEEINRVKKWNQEHSSNRYINPYYYPKHESFMNYDELVDTTVPKYFKLFKEEFFQYLYSELEKIYYAEAKLMQFKNIIYFDNHENRDISYYGSTPDIKDFFTYLSSFPTTKELIGVVQEKKNYYWEVHKDNYGEINDAIFLTLFWFFSIVIFLYHLIRVLVNMRT